MPLLLWIILFSLLGGILSVIAAGSFLLFPERIRERLLPHFVSFAIGSLLGVAFLGLLPHAITANPNIDAHDIGLTVLVGILVFFILEKLVLWRHCHSSHCEAHTPDHHQVKSDQAAGIFILIGDGLHNMVDGVLIAAAFMTDIHLGIVTSLAVAAHEIPQEVGDFAILLHSGFPRGKAFVFNIISSITTIIGALAAYYGLRGLESLLPYVLAIAASSFIYIAVADLIPGLHKRSHLMATLQQITLIIAGVAVIYVVHSALHQ